MTTFKKILLALLSLVSINAYAALTTYITEWGGYASAPYPTYPVHNAYINNYHSLKQTANQDMLDKAALSNVIAYAFLQVWNPDQKSHGIQVPDAWAEHLYFDDLR